MLKKMYDLQKKKGKKGFSMIELIIVIAIMAILIALIGAQLIPFLEKSRERKDLATLDTVLTNFKAAVGETEFNQTNVKYVGIEDPDLPTEVLEEYKNFAGPAYDSDDEIKAAFKSKEAKGEKVTLGIDKDGVLYVQVTKTNSKHGGLYVSEKYTGYVNGLSSSSSSSISSSSSPSSNGGSNQ